MSYAMKTTSRSRVEDVDSEDRKEMVGTAQDAQEMDRLGRQQQLNVRLSTSD